jgi:outer membrane protein OmpA-like peptidoglycan-associated protein
MPEVMHQIAAPVHAGSGAGYDARMIRILLLLAVVTACGPTAAGPKPPAPEPQPAAPVEARRTFDLDGTQLLLPAALVFEPGTATLDEASSADALAHILAFVEERADVTMVRIEAHSDGDGGEDDVMDTGERAWSVGAWLVAHGVDCHRLVIASFGGSKPISEDPAQNPRVEVYAAQLRDLDIGGMPADGGAPVAVDACP